MRRAFSFYNSSVGKKIWMAITGLMLLGFVVGHMVGNLKIYLGRDHYNEYAEGLRSLGAPIFPHEGLLWIVRVVLLAAVGTHMLSAWQTYRTSKTARGGVTYTKNESLVFAYASRTMRVGGVIILLFLIYHLLQLTLGAVYPGMGHGSVYDNVVTGFRVWWVSAFYIAAMIPLGWHMYHGLWSACQTLNINNPKIRAGRRPFAVAVALVVVIGNISIPLSVLTGIVK